MFAFCVIAASLVSLAKGRNKHPGFGAFNSSKCGLATLPPLNTNWGTLQLGLGHSRFKSNKWLNADSYCETYSADHPFYRYYVFVTDNNKLQEWKLTWEAQPANGDVPDACEKIHDIDMSDQADNILVHASYQDTVDQTKTPGDRTCQVKNLVFVKDYSDVPPEEFDWRPVREILFLFSGVETPGVETPPQALDDGDKARARNRRQDEIPKVVIPNIIKLYEEVVESVKTYQMSGARVYETDGQFNKTIALGLLQIAESGDMSVFEFTDAYQRTLEELDDADKTHVSGVLSALNSALPPLNWNIVALEPNSLQDGKWYLTIISTNVETPNDGYFYPYYDPLKTYAQPLHQVVRPQFVRPPPVS